MALWIGIDVGGTFTDLIAYDDISGRTLSHKTSSTPHNPAEAVIAGLGALIEMHGLSPGDVAQVAHGTTVGTNALIERKGAKVALVTTRGFRDVLEIARQRRPRHFDMYMDYPPALVPRWRRLEVDERALADGSIRVPLTQAEAERVVREAVETGAESFAVCLLFSYVTADHERTLGEMFAAQRPDAFISLSSEVHPEFREYERTSTTTMNAYLQPLMARYLRQVAREVAVTLPRADVVISQSTGGLMSLERACRFPVRTTLSGPAAGVLGAVEVAGLAGYENVITFDMGGTSADVAMVRDLEPAQAHDQVIGGLPLRLPSVGISTVGAGGGSITWFDSDDALKVGPRSAGAHPGPACYGLGGTDATVTDANLLLGRLSPSGLLGGTMNLDRDAAARAVHPIARRLGFSVHQTANGILSIVVSNMARVIRAISVEQGHDPRQLSLLAFGGAGPLHASAVARSLEMRRVIVPPLPGILCAGGLIASNLKEDFIHTCRTRLDSPSASDELQRTIEELSRLADAWFHTERILDETRYKRAALDIRYVGQNFEIQVPLASEALEELPSIEMMRSTFFSAHERTYGFFNPDAPVEVLNCRMTAGGNRHRAAPAPNASKRQAPGSPVGTREVWLDATDSIRFSIFQRTNLVPGQEIAGPAVIEQMDTTTLLFPGDRLIVDDYLNLIIEVSQ